MTKVTVIGLMCLTLVTGCVPKTTDVTVSDDKGRDSVIKCTVEVGGEPGVEDESRSENPVG